MKVAAVILASRDRRYKVQWREVLGYEESDEDFGAGSEHIVVPTYGRTLADSEWLSYPKGEHWSKNSDGSTRSNEEIALSILGPPPRVP